MHFAMTVASATPHTFSKFDQELARLDTLLVAMAHSGREQLGRALSALECGDVSQTAAIREADAAIDALEQDVQSLVIHMLTTRQPVADDLRHVIAALRIATDLERIGDHGKGIAKRLALMAGSTNPLTGRVVALGRTVERAFDKLIVAYEQRDVAAAHEIWAQDGEIDQEHLHVSTALSQLMERDPSTIGSGVQLHFIAKSIERTGDRLTNIAEQIAFYLEGVRTAGERPRVDPGD
jgi:phosphate transport system protein